MTNKSINYSDKNPDSSGQVVQATVNDKRIFIGTIGYHILSNHSIGPILLPQLQQQNWPEGVFIDELNWGPIAVVQQFEATKIPYDRIILLTAIERPARKIGDINVFQWQGGLPDKKQIQACVGDAATGVISVENLLVIGQYFKIWPKEVFLVDVEPGPEVAGEHLSEEVAVKVPAVIQTIQTLANEGPAKIKEITYLRGETLFL